MLNSTGGSGLYALVATETTVDAAACVPSSSKISRAFCRIWLMYSPPSSEMPEKSAESPNGASMPSAFSASTRLLASEMSVFGIDRLTSTPSSPNWKYASPSSHSPSSTSETLPSSPGSAISSSRSLSA